MTIEISCPQCFANLRVPDEAAGAQAKCPHCSEVFDVHDLAETLPGGELGQNPTAQASTAPTSVPSPFADPNPNIDPSTPPRQSAPASSGREDSFRDLNNPYASPASSPPPPGDGVGKAPLSLGRLDAGMTFSLAWELFLKNLPLLMMTHTTAFVVTLAISLTAETLKQNGQIGLSLAMTVIGYPIQWFLVVGLTMITLGVARGERMEFNHLFAGGPRFLRVAIYLLLYTLLVLIGTCLLIVPGIYLALRFWPGAHFIIDRDVSVMQAFELSSHHTQGNFFQAILLGFFSFGVLCAGLMLLTYGMYSLMWTIAFLMITRQPIQRGGV